jgi:hypothetical protein
MNPNTAKLILDYTQELTRTLGRTPTVRKEKNRILVISREDSPGNRYTIKELRKALAVLKKRPSYNALVPDFLTIP